MLILSQVPTYWKPVKRTNGFHGIVSSSACHVAVTYICCSVLASETGNVFPAFKSLIGWYLTWLEARVETYLRILGMIFPYGDINTWRRQLFAPFIGVLFFLTDDHAIAWRQAFCPS